ncbi:MAG: serine/threonine-protein kinase [Myxococcota bacterium]
MSGGPPASYHVDAILGQGSTSIVVLARPADAPDTHVVVKVLQRDLLEHRELLARARDEARLLAMLSHPNIVAVHSLVVHHGHPLVVMECVYGADLGALLRIGNEPLPPADATEVVRRTALALDAAHHAPDPEHPGRTLRVIHRDIKPSNLLLSVDGEVKVVDFGLARAEFAARETRTDGYVLGSMGFDAPERYGAEPVTEAVDIYALGVTWFQLLTARVLVVPRAAERHDIERDKQLARVALPELAPEQAEAVRACIAAMTAHDPAQRPTAREAAERIAALALPGDLVALAAARIPAVRAQHPRLPPREHPAWADVAFLEQPEPRPLSRLLGWFRRG